MTDETPSTWRAVEAAHPDPEQAKHGIVGYRVVNAAGVVQAEMFPRPYPVAVVTFNASRIAAAPDALHACELLRAAYKAGKEGGGSVPWETLDLAHAAALKALRIARTAPERLARPEAGRTR